ncbi:MAG: PTPA-CTERM sorting domain-containing protein [Synechococcales bacterium]|nr:PTPA-CTERM sorting domain-containing protein [Synechococcales bacterium]
MVSLLLNSLPMRSLCMFVAIVTTSLVVANPVQAASLVDFNAADRTGGNVTNFGTPGTVDLASDGIDNFFGDLETFVGLDPALFELNNPPGSLDPQDQAYQGSAVRFNVNAGDTITFDWAFDLFDNDSDYAFFVFNGVREIFANADGAGNRSFTATTAGLFSLGLVDIGDTLGPSTLNLQNVQITPIPTPALLPGLVGLGVTTLRRRRQQLQKKVA